ncbi:LysR family substrate-binding domain-containing protein [Streptomyces sp. TS71-3]|uniref:LysR family substrate-binding domain-containing protein n=1 Tax=Streptomyces sp. TS71-3 TaxID=2733862 RepID=UPI001B148366|nr:LysR family substrate-binding domain-containing protein [Streptomyces sp. TS71-3]GHJ37257.1 hypothetical protein Sm713_28660 [Streptomyces sp. TS71-3]
MLEKAALLAQVARCRVLDLVEDDAADLGAQHVRVALLVEDPLLLAVPDASPLAGRADIAPEDLAELPWIAVEGGSEAWRDDFVASCLAVGFRPDIRLEAPDPLAAVGLVASGLGMALVQRSMLPGRTAGVTTRPLPWLGQSVRLWAAWHRIDLRPVVTSFRETVLRAGADHGRPAGADPAGPGLP